MLKVRRLWWYRNTKLNLEVNSLYICHTTNDQSNHTHGHHIYCHFPGNKSIFFLQQLRVVVSGARVC